MNSLDQKNNIYLKLTAYFLGFIVFIILVAILYALSDILIPFVLAIFLTFLFHPLLKYLNRRKIPKAVALFLIIILVSLLYYLFGLLIVSSLSAFPERMELYVGNLKKFLDVLLVPLNLTLTEAASIFNIDLKNLNVDSIFGSLFEAGIIQNVVNSITVMLGDFFIVLIFWIFMIMGKERFEDRLKFAFAENRGMVVKNLDTIDTQLQSYLLIKTILSLFTGLIATIILLIFNVDFAIIWGLLTFLLNFIPNIGSLIATIAPISVGLLEFGLGWHTVSLAALLLLNQSIIGNLVEPHFLGRKMDLSPVFVLFSLIFWGWIWGFVGMFLAVPIAASIKIFCSNIEPLKPVAILMGTKAERTKPDDMKTIKVR
jgi:AI-2 transport protein TqsA